MITDKTQTPADAWVTAMRRAEELIETMQDRAKTSRKTSAEDCQALANQAGADFQECSLAFAQADAALAQLKARPPADPEQRRLWERKVQKLAGELGSARSHAQAVFRGAVDALKAQAQAAFVLGRDQRGPAGGGRTAANLVEERELLEGSSRLAGESVAAGGRVLGSLDRQESLLQSVRASLLAIGDDLGRSSLLARIIGQRARADNQLIAALTLVTALTILLLYLLVKGYFG